MFEYNKMCVFTISRQRNVCVYDSPTTQILRKLPGNPTRMVFDSPTMHSVVPSIVRTHILPFVEDHECFFFEKMLWQKFDNTFLHFLQLLIRQPGTYMACCSLLFYVTNLPRTLLFAWLLLLNFMACIE